MDNEAPATGGFGKALIAARTKAGVELREISNITKIQHRYLEALEEEMWSDVPGGIIGRGFVRLYAKEVGADPAPLLELYAAARGEPASKAVRPQPPESSLRVRRGDSGPGKPLFLALVFLVVVSIAGGALYWWAPWAGAPEEAAKVAAPAAAALHRLQITASGEARVALALPGGEESTWEFTGGQTRMMETPGPVTVRGEDVSLLTIEWDGQLRAMGGEAGVPFSLTLPGGAEAAPR